MSYLKIMAPAALILSMGVFQAWAGGERTFGSAGIRAEAVSASASKSNATLVVTLVITNESSIAKQLFIAEEPTAVDNEGHSFSLNPNIYPVGGIYVCNNPTECLNNQKERTNDNATIVDANHSITVTLAFPFGAGKAEIGDTVSVGLLVHARSAVAEGDPSAKWRTVSLGVPDISLRGV
ncbi:hypothetical protein QA644_25025 (plasmid) [Rhizobium sp. CC1099]|uniref:hypothetical protein n=1 Tax=Rhizobium sp. CC1099 TaxID=3039160 RepID=UPI0024B048DF|nr:hypothetical protein [Rhizobium sp. CC1099]WFU91422.1 hypothetical protein QA644_25025 [Rhizobium sp. CC1099]